MTNKYKKALFSEWEQEQVEFIIENMDKRDFFIASVPHVAASGMSRHIKFAMIDKHGEFKNITYLISKLIGQKLNKNDCLTVGGCGMDMIFHTLLSVAYALDMPKQGHEYDAVQNYKYF